jgi:hypothetical protein
MPDRKQRRNRNMPKFEIEFEVPAHVSLWVKAPTEKIVTDWAKRAGGVELDATVGPDDLYDVDFLAAVPCSIKRTTKGEPDVELDKNGEEL